MNELKRTLSSVLYQLYTNALLVSVLLGVSAYLITATFTKWQPIAFLAGLFGLMAGLALRRIDQNKRPQAIQLIHQRVSDSEYSLHLLDKSDLNIADQLQLDRLNERLQRVEMPTVAFAGLGTYIAVLLASVLLYIGYPLLTKTQSPIQKALLGVTASEPAKPPVPPTFQSAKLQIQPPAYTRLPTTQSADLNAVAITGSLLNWQLRFSDTRQLSVRLANSRGVEVKFTPSGDQFLYHDKLTNSGLYAIKAYWRNPSGKSSLVYQSDFYRLEAQPDLAPKIEPDSKELYRYHYLKDKKQISISAKISDDFSVTHAYIVATLARGSGENVKFREVKLPLGPVNFKSSTLNKTIDLAALNFTPGDELYYYWAAFDNRQPEPNFSKSDTYFLVYKDTTKVEDSELATMAVNAMPEYFRSQRQIIIDTEKLIAKRKKLPKQTFNSTSNEIGYDQKVLRLRYGQFLGEEFETSIGGGGGEAGFNEDDPLAGFRHDHDTGKGEPGGGETHEEHHDHGEAPKGDGNEDPMAALMSQYVHSHDNAETNTFHEQSTRSLLKMSLEQMWQSELHLRMYEPEKALPFETKALEYLKIVQQKSRSYAKKTGLDPPPIKEKETRLTGEFKNVNTDVRQDRTFSQERMESLAADVAGYLELTKLTAIQQRTVQQLATYLSENGLPNWTVLQALQKLAGNKPLSASEKQAIKTQMFRLTGNKSRAGAAPAYVSERTLERAFWRHLK